MLLFDSASLLEEHGQPIIWTLKMSSKECWHCLSTLLSKDGQRILGISIFIVVFILIGSFFSIDLFGAVLAFHYDIAQRKSKNKYLSDE